MIPNKDKMASVLRRPPNWMSGLAAIVMLPASAALSVAAVGAELPIPAKQAVQPPRSMQRTCVGTDGKSFRWDQPNAPFASTCSFDTDGPATANPAAK